MGFDSMDSDLLIKSDAELSDRLDDIFHIIENKKRFDLSAFTQILMSCFCESTVQKIMDTIERECELFIANDPASEGHTLEQVLSKRRGMKALAIHEVVSNVLSLKPEFLDTIETKMTWVQESMNVEIHPSARISSAAIDHGTGTVIGGTAIIEDGVFIYHSVTLGNSRGAEFATDTGRRHPWLQSGARVFAGANVFGPSILKVGARVSANGVVIDSIVGKNSVVGPGVQIRGVEIPDDTRIFWSFMGRFCIGKKRGGRFSRFMSLKKIGLADINETEWESGTMLDEVRGSESIIDSEKVFSSA